MATHGVRFAISILLLAACGSSKMAGDVDAAGQPGTDAAHGDAGPGSGSGSGSGSGRVVFVIPMENEPASKIYGNTTDAPYLQALYAQAARATMFQDELPNLDSEPHYIWMEAGTNALPDHTFSSDSVPSAGNSSASTDHLVAQLAAAHIPWTSYQQGMTAGTCPIAAVDDYAPKHDPMVFFQDVSGSPPSASAEPCKSHHKPYAAFAADLPSLSGYVFITPDLCHDMHGAIDCPQGTNTAGNIKAGDAWLAAELPRILDFASTRDALVFLVWDEGDASNLIPFYALGPHANANTTSATVYTHGSLVKTVEEFLGVPVLPKVAATNDFADLLAPGTL